MRFDELDLEDEILDGLDDMNFQEMTPVQEHTIPVILDGRDIIGCAQTGTGKTAAYTLPLLNKLLIEGNPDNVVKSLIIVPTRELAQQIDQQFQGFSYYLPVSTTVVYGGGDGKGWDVQKRGMLMGSDVVIATPGRMISHIQNSGIDLSHVECLILDEADRMLDMGFSEDIMKIVSYMPKDRQTIMFSATLPPKIREMARTILRNPAEVNIAISKPNEAIDQSAYVCYENQKLGIIREMFAEPTDSKTIIFSSSKLKVKELAHTLKRMKLNVAAMHSDLEQAQREEVMLDFKNNKVSILVATDIVARGIDIEDIGLVINYDVPHDPEDYIHRIGRTARANRDGVAITLVSEQDQYYFQQIEKFLEKTVEKVPLPEDVGEAPEYSQSARPAKGKSAKLEAVLHVPAELGNEYAYRVGEVDWVFTVNAFSDDLMVVRKVWSDGSGNDHAKDVVKANLICDGKVVCTKELTKDNGWTETFSKLRDGGIDDLNIENHTWKIEEAEVPYDYTVSYSTDGNVTIITNTRNHHVYPDYDADITVNKKWSNDAGYKRPKYALATLYSGDKAIETVRLDASNGWSYSWKKLPAGGNWHVMESSVPAGYTPVYSATGDVVTITNTAQLIQTGQLNWPVFALGAAGAILVILGGIVLLKKRKKA